MTRNPVHPGAAIREACMKPLGLTVTEAAAGLGVTSKYLSEVLSGQCGLSPELAIRLEKLGWKTAETWLHMQMTWDLWQARQRASKIQVNELRGEPQSS